VSQIVSGILLAMHYQGSASFAFASVEHKIKYLIIIYVFLGNLSLIKFYYYRNNYSIQDAFSDNTLILDLNKKISNIAPVPVSLNEKGVGTRIDDRNFYEWLRGLIDGEGCFHINVNK
jgi:hypothetical protein